ncbi:MAG: METTL5 family protein [Candidatus Thermoplasmatota archaeon]|nr:METTL5 family protein [Candidatus Thermoplasmatota archaeon]MBU1941550.1 METTL5 family protein [Candidatus Thermoplasmatota archaeon]
MKQKELAILLETISPPKVTNPTLEQYYTPASITADIIYSAHYQHDITEKTIIDLGCGTGIFAIAAALTGAHHVIGVDIDPQLVKQAQHNAEMHHLDLEFITADIQNLQLKADTIFMNPPFGAQKPNQHADRLFLEKASTFAPVIYSLHLSKTIPFITTLLSALDFTITHTKTYSFPIKHQFHFHQKPVKYFDVTLIRTIKK